MKFRPCIDIHNGRVKQIVGASLRDKGDEAVDNFVSENGGGYYAEMFRKRNLTGGHIILLNPADSPWYEATRKQALDALAAWPDGMQLGGGVNAENAEAWLDAGASHVIVTSYAFAGGIINYGHLEALKKAVGSEHVVLDVSCRKKEADSDRFFIVTDRWQKFTDVELSVATLNELADYCDEFLIHAADVEGRQNGIEDGVVKILGDYAGRSNNYTGKSCTYAGGVHTLDDISRINRLGEGRLDVTVGSALEIFGGTMTLDEVIAACKA
ncbi:MAG: phosphoribosylformimino-5-aminoimidazole carboxamide ribotide isomerase [Lachnospiraceae bacterium]|nr:phosphoribosylformimino-5-aminoimidazole carboxamide ribotide isomerase [Lachnospiraceae bacterium]